MTGCEDCIHLVYEQYTNALYCSLDLDEPTEPNEDGDIICESYDSGEGDVDGDAIRNGD